jgi:hypothetical protein
MTKSGTPRWEQRSPECRSLYRMPLARDDKFASYREPQAARLVRLRRAYASIRSPYEAETDAS